jgi:hypothetical protein
MTTTTTPPGPDRQKSLMHTRSPFSLRHVRALAGLRLLDCEEHHWPVRLKSLCITLSALLFSFSFPCRLFVVLT